MKALHCRCGQAVYFDNHQCAVCGRALAFDPGSLSMVSEIEPGAGLPTCAQRDSDIRCNWLSPQGGLCLSCRSSKTIPGLSKIVNRDRWRKLEQAKRRLLYDLLRHGLPVSPQHLRFVFKEDRRSNPDVSENHVAIGHLDGVITINAAEADEVYREEMRQRMNEPVRTLLGHFRHESGHYYFDVVLDESMKNAARQLFGDERTDYNAALQAYYDNGPMGNWQDEHITAYASAHPMEDWAECWAHYLHIRAALESADTQGLQEMGPETDWHRGFVSLALGLNEVLRSLGLPDAYPFVITPPIAAKIEFVHTAIERFRSQPHEP